MPSLAGRLVAILTVRDAVRSADWYARVLGFEPASEFRDADDQVIDIVMTHPSGLTLGLVVHREATDAAFDERRIGLDHLEFVADSPDEVEAWAARLDELGIEHSGVKTPSHTRAAILTFRDPDNIQLEIYCG